MWTNVSTDLLDAINDQNDVVLTKEQIDTLIKPENETKVIQAFIDTANQTRNLWIVENNLKDLILQGWINWMTIDSGWNLNFNIYDAFQSLKKKVNEKDFNAEKLKLALWQSWDTPSEVVFLLQMYMKNNWKPNVQVNWIADQNFLDSLKQRDSAETIDNIKKDYKYYESNWVEYVNIPDNQEVEYNWYNTSQKFKWDQIEIWAQALKDTNWQYEWDWKQNHFSAKKEIKVWNETAILLIWELPKWTNILNIKNNYTDVNALRNDTMKLKWEAWLNIITDKGIKIHEVWDPDYHEFIVVDSVDRWQNDSAPIYLKENGWKYETSMSNSESNLNLSFEKTSLQSGLEVDADWKLKFKTATTAPTQTTGPWQQVPATQTSVEPLIDAQWKLNLKNIWFSDNQDKQKQIDLFFWWKDIRFIKFDWLLESWSWNEQKTFDTTLCLKKDTNWIKIELGSSKTEKEEQQTVIPKRDADSSKPDQPEIKESKLDVNELKQEIPQLKNVWELKLDQWKNSWNQTIELQKISWFPWDVSAHLIYWQDGNISSIKFQNWKNIINVSNLPAELQMSYNMFSKQEDASKFINNLIVWLSDSTRYIIFWKLNNLSNGKWFETNKELENQIIDLDFSKIRQEYALIRDKTQFWDYINKLMRDTTIRWKSVFEWIFPPESPEQREKNEKIRTLWASLNLIKDKCWLSAVSIIENQAVNPTDKTTITMQKKWNWDLKTFELVKVWTEFKIKLDWQHQTEIWKIWDLWLATKMFETVDSLLKIEIKNKVNWFRDNLKTWLETTLNSANLKFTLSEPDQTNSIINKSIKLERTVWNNKQEFTIWFDNDFNVSLKKWTEDQGINTNLLNVSWNDEMTNFVQELSQKINPTPAPAITPNPANPHR